MKGDPEDNDFDTNTHDPDDLPNYKSPIKQRLLLDPDNKATREDNRITLLTPLKMSQTRNKLSMNSLRTRLRKPLKLKTLTVNRCYTALANPGTSLTVPVLIQYYNTLSVQISKEWRGRNMLFLLHYQPLYGAKHRQY